MHLLSYKTLKLSKKSNYFSKREKVIEISSFFNGLMTSTCSLFYVVVHYIQHNMTKEREEEKKRKFLIFFKYKTDEQRQKQRKKEPIIPSKNVYIFYKKIYESEILFFLPFLNTI